MKFFYNLSKKSISLVFGAVVLYSLYPGTVQAGLFSLISEIVNDRAVAQTVEEPLIATSQNMALLQAAVNSDPNPHKADDYTILAYNNALVAEVGPQGTVSEIKEEVSTDISLYTVREGDNLSTIAELFGVSQSTIISANQLSKNPVLYVGDQLVILPITGIRYRVKSGDSIRSIVLKHGADLKEVMDYNNLTNSSVLAVGDVIIIPDIELPISSAVQIATKKGVAPLGYYLRPISGGRLSQGIHGNNAVDLAAPIGTIIRASADGTVISSISNGAWNGGYGNYIIISHSNGTKTLYAHNQKNFVKAGDLVKKGDMIAKVGNTGRVTGPHVHFEVRTSSNNSFKNPITY
ncbi:MAG TPA: peptidoglycan DD-metalloendopeptidase family protein [Candidatus Paceibacterota bacterium]